MTVSPVDTRLEILLEASQGILTKLLSPFKWILIYVCDLLCYKYSQCICNLIVAKIPFNGQCRRVTTACV